jgi:hypothetical protein
MGRRQSVTPDSRLGSLGRGAGYLGIAYGAFHYGSCYVNEGASSAVGAFARDQADMAETMASVIPAPTSPLGSTPQMLPLSLGLQAAASVWGWVAEALGK